METKSIEALTEYLEKAKELDLVTDDGRFIAAFIQMLLNEYGSIDEDFLLEKSQEMLRSLEEYAKLENSA